MMGLTPDEVRESHCNEWISQGSLHLSYLEERTKKNG